MSPAEVTSAEMTASTMAAPSAAVLSLRRRE
jgi:hypothetical protein